VPSADVVLITGTTLLNDTLENLLALCRPEARVLGGVRVTAPDAFLDVLAEGGSGYHFFGRSAEKVVLVRNAMALASRAA
jgi:uncharacterized protein